MMIGISRQASRKSDNIIMAAVNINHLRKARRVNSIYDHDLKNLS